MKKSSEFTSREIVAIRGALSRLPDHPSGLPMRELVGLATELGGRNLLIDLDTARMIGMPVIVLRAGRPSEILAALTPRQKDVAGLVAQGMSNKQIARRLRLSLPTVKDHVHHILRRTGCTSRAALAVALAYGKR